MFAVVDHSGEAEKQGLELRETKLVIFGSPVAGTPVMQAVPLAAIDLPLKILIWDSGGETSVSYVTPSTIAARYGLSTSSGSVSLLSRLLRTLWSPTSAQPLRDGRRP